MNKDEALFWFQEGFHAGAQAERRRLRTEETARRERALNRDLQQVIGILAVALLDEAHRTASAAARNRRTRER
jgi:hypothetical protein